MTWAPCTAVTPGVSVSPGSPPDGYFLVRDSTSAPGDFGLSVVVDGDVIHYQIRQHGQDAFYSIGEWLGMLMARDSAIAGAALCLNCDYEK